MAADQHHIRQFPARSVTPPPNQLEPRSVGWPKNKQERYLDQQHSVQQRFLRRIDQLHLEATRTIDRAATITSVGYADATNRMQAIADAQQHPAVQQRVEAFNTQTIDPLLQKALGGIFIESVEKVAATVAQQMLPPEEQKRSLWERLTEW